MQNLKDPSSMADGAPGVSWGPSLPQVGRTGGHGEVGKRERRRRGTRLRYSPASGLLGTGRILAGKGRRRPVLVPLRGQRWSGDGTASRRGGAGAVWRGDLHGGHGLAARGGGALLRRHGRSRGAAAGPRDHGLGRARWEVAMQERSRRTAAIPDGARDSERRGGLIS